MDDLTRIKGVGKAAAERMVAAGIDSFEKLAHDGIAGEHGIKVEWIAAAAELLHGGPEPELTGNRIRVIAPGGRRRRAGFSFTSVPTDLDVAQLGQTAEEQEAAMKKLLQDRALSVSPVPHDD